ncbi:MAG: multicopper oxidase domain-containing protein [Devosiaceae bacterium]|nr:multicopper oxidase domain-containing protein [Devosiaceae bacterium]
MSSSVTGFSRRKLLLGTAAVGVAATTTAMVFGRGPLAAGHVQGSNPLKIPPLDLGKIENNTRVYDLDIQHGKTEFFGGLQTPTMGINGSYLGPVLRMRENEDIRINVTNSINEDATLHWHGFNLPAIADGGPHQVIRPGATWSPQFKVVEKASTMWYHSHLMGKTAEHVWAGLAGMIIVDDEQSQTLDLPNTYGVDDLPIALQDRRFLQDGTMPYAPSMHDNMMGMTGDTPMVNGTIGAYFETTTSLVRLRLLNASNGTIYSMGFSDGRFFKKIATDGGLLAAPVDVQLISMGPGERAEIIVDLSDGKNVTLTHFVRLSQSEVSPEFSFLELRPSPNSTMSKPISNTLATLPALMAETAQNTRRFDLDMRGMMGMGMGGGFTINGEQMDMKVINHTIKKDSVEIWEIRNLSRMAHPFHIHNTQFRILDRDGRPPEPHEDGLKDTVLVLPGRSARILISFKHYTDEKVPYMYHCHILEHEDAGMMGQFTVV